jgi:mannose-6-phosphate isomerase
LSRGVSRNCVDPLFVLESNSADRLLYWAARASITFNQPGIIDRGIFSVYLLNLVIIPAGQAVFQDAGLPHAYLEGQNIEIMANSDNVLRGGLTTKQVDVVELMKHVVFEATNPNLLKGEFFQRPEEKVFKTPAKDFELSEISISEKNMVQIPVHSCDIFLVLKGSVAVNQSLQRSAGEAFAAFAGAVAEIASKDGTAIIYRATVPV